MFASKLGSGADKNLRFLASVKWIHKIIQFKFIRRMYLWLRQRAVKIPPTPFFPTLICHLMCSTGQNDLQPSLTVLLQFCMETAVQVSVTFRDDVSWGEGDKETGGGVEIEVDHLFTNLQSYASRHQPKILLKRERLAQRLAIFYPVIYHSKRRITYIVSKVITPVCQWYIILKNSNLFITRKNN